MKACRGVDRQCLLDINRYEFYDLMFEEAIAYPGRISA